MHYLDDWDLDRILTANQLLYIQGPSSDLSTYIRFASNIPCSNRKNKHKTETEHVIYKKKELFYRQLGHQKIDMVWMIFPSQTNHAIWTTAHCCLMHLTHLGCWRPIDAMHSNATFRSSMSNYEYKAIEQKEIYNTLIICFAKSLMWLGRKCRFMCL